MILKNRLFLSDFTLKIFTNGVIIFKCLKNSRVTRVLCGVTR